MTFMAFRVHNAEPREAGESTLKGSQSENYPPAASPSAGAVSGRPWRILFAVKYDYYVRTGKGMRLRHGHTVWWGHDAMECKCAFSSRFYWVHNVRVVACCLSSICKTRVEDPVK
jgi:hypothetical protein